MEIFAPLGRARSIDNTRNGPKLMYPDWNSMLTEALICIAQSYNLKGQINEIADQIKIKDMWAIDRNNPDHYFPAYETFEGEFTSTTLPVVYIWAIEFKYNDNGDVCVLGLTTNMEWHTWMD